MSDLTLNHLDYLQGGFRGLLSLNISIMGFNVYFFPFGSIFLLRGILHLRNLVNSDSAHAFLSLFYVYLLLETALVLFHLQLGFSLLAFEFLFYFKFLFIYIVYYKFFLRFSALVFKFLLFISFLFWFSLNVVLLLLSYYGLFFNLVYNTGLFSDIGALYLNDLSILVYLEYLLPLLFFLFILVATIYRYVNEPIKEQEN